MGTLHQGMTIDGPTQQALYGVSGLALLPTGVLAESYPRVLGATAQTMTTANANYTAISLTKGTVVSNLSFWSGSTAAGTPTHALAGLYSAAFAQLATSADGTSTAWAANAKRTFAMTTPYTVLADGIFYVCLAQVATTPATVNGMTANAVLADQTPPVAFTDSSNTISTTIPATAVNSAGGLVLYCQIT